MSPEQLVLSVAPAWPNVSEALSHADVMYYLVAYCTSWRDWQQGIEGKSMQTKHLLIILAIEHYLFLIGVSVLLDKHYASVEMAVSA